MSKIIYYTHGVSHLDKTKNLVIDNHIDYRLAKYDGSCDVHTNLSEFLCFDELKSVYTNGVFDEINIIHGDKVFYCKFDKDKQTILHNFETHRELRFAHNLRKLFTAGGLFEVVDETNIHRNPTFSA